MPTPSKFTATVRETLLETRSVGAPMDDCCAIAGIGKATLIRWLDKGREAKEPDSAYGEFAREWEAASAAMGVRALGIVSRAMADKPELAFKVVERRVKGWAPPVPGGTQVHVGPQILALDVPNSPALPAEMMVEGEVIDIEQQGSARGSLPASTG